MQAPELAERPLYIRNSDIRADTSERYLKLSLCEAIDSYVPNYIQSVQQIGGYWKIWVRSEAAREHLLKKIITIKFKNRKIELHDDNPFNSHRTPSEKIVIRDLPLDMAGDNITNYLENEFPHIIIRSDPILDRIPSRSNNLTHFYSGDRIIYAKAGFFPVLPKQAKIDGVPCKIWHMNQDMHCKRCDSHEHRTVDTHTCEAYSETPNTDVFKHDNDPRSNFYICKNKISVFEREWITAEHPYQWAKLAHNGYQELADEVIAAPTARAAKDIADRVPHHALNNWSNEKKLSVMYDIVRAKLESCNELRNALVTSQSKLLVEGTIDPFWGAGIPLHLAAHTLPEKLKGRNELGNILTKLREEMMKTLHQDKLQSQHSPATAPPATDTNSNIEKPSSTELPHDHITDETVLPPAKSNPVPKNKPDPAQTGNVRYGGSSTTRVVAIIENDIELFPKALAHLQGRRPRSLTRERTIRTSSLGTLDRRDMRPIDEYFVPGKRKASGAATSPNSEAASKMSKTGNDDGLPTSLSVIAMAEIESDTGSTES